MEMTTQELETSLFYCPLVAPLKEITVFKPNNRHRASLQAASGVGLKSLLMVSISAQI